MCPILNAGLVFISGQGPVLAGGGAICGRLGDGLDIEDGARAAQLSALNILAQIRALSAATGKN